MLATDLQGFIDQLKNNKLVHLFGLFLVCVIIYMLVAKYIIKPTKSNFNDILVGTVYGLGGRCTGSIPKMDEAIIRNMIDLPNRDPRMLTSSLVVPEIVPKDEDRRKTRMDILNMFYNSFDDDTISVSKRPKGLYVIP